MRDPFLLTCYRIQRESMPLESFKAIMRRLRERGYTNLNLRTSLWGGYLGIVHEHSAVGIIEYRPDEDTVLYSRNLSGDRDLEVISTMESVWSLREAFRGPIGNDQVGLLRATGDFASDVL